MPTSLPMPVRERLKRLLLTEVAPRFADYGENWQSAAAQAIGVNQSTISRLVAKEPRGGSVEFGQKLGRFINLSPERVLYGTGDNESPRLRDLPGFPEAFDAAKKKIADERRNIDARALHKAADFRGNPPFKEVTADLLIALAMIEMNATNFN